MTHLYIRLRCIPLSTALYLHSEGFSFTDTMMPMDTFLDIVITSFLLKKKQAIASDTKFKFEFHLTQFSINVKVLNGGPSRNIQGC